MTTKNFSVTMGKGFQMKLPNGWVVSIQIGSMNYCENRDFFVWETPKDESGHVSCENAETAVFHSVTEEWARPPWNTGDQVQGWQSPEEVLRLLTWAATLPASGIAPENPLTEDSDSGTEADNTN